MNNLPIRWGDNPRLADVRARVEADAALLRAVLALYAACWRCTRRTFSTANAPTCSPR